MRTPSNINGDAADQSEHTTCSRLVNRTIAPGKCDRVIVEILVGSSRCDIPLFLGSLVFKLIIVLGTVLDMCDIKSFFEALLNMYM